MLLVLCIGKWPVFLFLFLGFHDKIINLNLPFYLKCLFVRMQVSEMNGSGINGWCLGSCVPRDKN